MAAAEVRHKSQVEEWMRERDAFPSRASHAGFTHGGLLGEGVLRGSERVTGWKGQMAWKQADGHKELYWRKRLRREGGVDMSR